MHEDFFCMRARFDPSDGYASVSLVNMALKDGKKPDRDTGKVTLFSLESLGMILDHAKNTDEAIGIIEKHNLYFPKVPQHFLISDKSGHSVIIEYGKTGVSVIGPKSPYQICANAPVFGSALILAGYREIFCAGTHFNNDAYGNSYYRLLAAEDDLIRNKGSLSAETGMTMLKDVSMDRNSQDTKYPTLWSVVYLSTGAVTVAIARNYGNIYRYRPDMSE